MAILVPENVQKKQARDSKQKQDLLKAREARKQAALISKESALQRAQKYQKEYKTQEQTILANKRQAKAQGGFFVESESKIMLVIRIRGINKLHPDVAKIMRLLRLRQIHNAVFVRVNTATQNMLKKVEPFVTFGYPSLKTIKDLIYKRGFLKVNKQRIPISNNGLIESTLGKQDQICVEDLIHEIYTCGPNFKTVNNTLWPFKLRCPRGGFNEKRHGYHNGGDYGNREEHINELVKKML